ASSSTSSSLVCAATSAPFERFDQLVFVHLGAARDVGVLGLLVELFLGQLTQLTAAAQEPWREARDPRCGECRDGQADDERVHVGTSFACASLLCPRSFAVETDRTRDRLRAEAARR